MDKTVKSAASYAYNVSAYDTASNESSLSATLEVKTQEPSIRADLLGYWKFNEERGRIAIDSSGSVLDDTTYPLTIWARGALGEATFFDGLMDEVQLYGYALTEEEIMDIYNSFAP